MKKINKNLSIVPHKYENRYENNYINQLKGLIDDIKILSWIINQLKLNKNERDFIIKFKKFTEKEMFDFNESIFNIENRGKWYNFIFTLNPGDDIKLNDPLTYLSNSTSDECKLLLANDYNFKKSLFIFWRMIANNLKSNTWFRIGFKISLKITKKNDLLYGTTIIRTISPVQNYNKENFKDCYEIFVRYIEQMSEFYKNFEITSIIFIFCINKEDSILNKKVESEPDVNENLSSENNLRIKNKLKLYIKNLPITTDLNKWGKIRVISGSYPYNFNDLINNITTKIFIDVKDKHNNYIVEIKLIVHNNKNYIMHKVTVVNKKFIKPTHEFIDILENVLSFDNFTRIINNQLIAYSNNEPVYIQNRHKTDYFTKVKKCDSVNKNFITMDLETKNINGNLEPYCICIFDGKNSYSFYVTDFSSSEEMVKNALKFLMKRKYNRNIVYLHNFSYFDGIFLFGTLLKIIDNPTKNIKPLMRNGRIINLKVTFLTETKKNKEVNYSINFRDSYLLLTASLSKLGKTFSSDKMVKQEKWFFPFNFINEPHIGYDYIGNVPDIKYFNGMNQETYNNYLEFVKDKNKSLSNWNLKNETIFYCEQDCRTLYFVIDEFGKEIFKLFRISISKTPTISSLAFRIFRSSYIYDNTKIAIINNELYTFLYKGFYGGAVDAYIPYGKDIKCYDVNSLYPNSMFNNLIPVGNPYYFEGDLNYFKNYLFPDDDYLNSGIKERKYNTISKYVINIFNLENYNEFETEIISFLNLENKKGVLTNENNLPFGFFVVNLETPTKDEWNEPILLKRHKTKFGGYRTIAPVGKWNGVYFSEELYNAKNLNSNHKFKINCGFLFRSDFIFKEYVDELYKIKERSDKNSPLYAISKLLLNSLFGRFGMKPDIDQHIIYDLNNDLNNEIDELFYNKKVDIIAEFEGSKQLLSVKNRKPNSELVNLMNDFDNNDSLLINVSISAAITGYSRIYMSLFKNNPLFKLYYSDSAFVDVNLDQIFPELVGKKLGQLKLENTFDKVLFLGAKLYGGVTNLGEIILKIKGINIKKNPITFDQLESLIFKDKTLELPNEKWYRDLGKGSIEIKQEIYKLAVSSSKRYLIYDQNGVLIKTEPIEVNE